MFDFVGISLFLRITYLVAMETMHFHIAQLSLFSMATIPHVGVPMNTLAHMSYCPG